MTNIGILGLPRLTSIGPLSCRQEVSSYEGLENALLEVIEEENIDPENVREDDFITIVDSLGDKVFPGDSRAAERQRRSFKGCVSSENSRAWAFGFTNVTTGEQSGFEEIILRAKYCIGIVGGT